MAVWTAPSAVDPPKAQHQTVHPQQRPVQSLHGSLDRPLRRGGGVGHRQGLPAKVVLQLKPPLLCLPALLRLHLPRQQPLAWVEVPEQLRCGHRRLLAVKNALSPAKGQGQHHHRRGGCLVQRAGLPPRVEVPEQLRCGHRRLLAVKNALSPAKGQGQHHHRRGGCLVQRAGLPPRQAIAEYPVAVGLQKLRQSPLPPVTANDPKTPVHPSRPLTSWYGPDGGWCLSFPGKYAIVFSTFSHIQSKSKEAPLWTHVLPGPSPP